MTALDVSGAYWYKSKRSGNGGACVEIAVLVTKGGVTS